MVISVMKIKQSKKIDTDIEVYFSSGGRKVFLRSDVQEVRFKRKSVSVRAIASAKALRE